MSLTASKPTQSHFSPLSVLMLALISGFAANHAAVNATTVGSNILPSSISTPFAPVVAKPWGHDDRLGNFGDVYHNFGNYNHDQGYFMLMVQQPNRYWYYPNSGESTNPWWWFVGNNLETATKVTQNIKATLQSGRYKVRPWVGKVGDQYLNISRTAPMVDVYSLKVLGSESAAYPAAGTDNTHWKFVETINFSQPASTFSHGATFPQLGFDVNDTNPIHFSDVSYQINYALSAQLEHKTLMSRFNRHLPSGRNVTALQAESAQTPDSAGTVKRIFQNLAASSHSTQVANILGKTATYPALRTKYIGVSPNLRSYQTATTEDFRNFNASAGPGNWYPATSTDGSALTPPDIMNVSNSNGGSTASYVRQYDRMLERSSILGCTAQNGSVSSGNWTVSGNSYNAITVDQPNGNWANDSGTKVNDHGVRQKPDLVSFGHDGASSSFSTPTACTIAAMMIERVKADPDMTNGNKPEVLKAIMMAGANRVTNFRRGSWERSSDTNPLSDKYGAGYASANGAYMVLDAGRQPFGSNTKGSGWDFGKDLVPGATRTYMIGVDKRTQVTAVASWMRRISDDSNNSDMPNLDIYLKNASGYVVGKSISNTNNVELIDVQLLPGKYTIEVTRSASDTSGPVNFGLAWSGRTFAPTPIITGVASASNYTVSWVSPDGDQNNFTYWFAAANDAGIQDVVTAYATDATSQSFPLSYANKYFQVIALPFEGNYGTQYPGIRGFKQ